MLKNAPPLSLRVRCEIPEGNGLEIVRYGRRDASWFGAASSNLNPCTVSPASAA
jgi:hypothetical protein